MAKQGKAAAQGGGGAPKKGMKKDLTGRQKAAIFLVTLGSEISSEIFKHLREDEIEALTFEIARLDNIDSEDRDTVLMEFKDLMMAQDFITSGGIDYARELLEKSLGAQKAVDIINRLTSSLQVRPFDFIRRTDPAPPVELYSAGTSSDYCAYPCISGAAEGLHHTGKSSPRDSVGCFQAYSHYGQD